MPAKEDRKAPDARAGPWLAGPTTAGAWQWYQHAGGARVGAERKIDIVPQPPSETDGAADREIEQKISFFCNRAD